MVYLCVLNWREYGKTMTRRMLCAVLVTVFVAVSSAGCARKAVYVDGMYSGYSEQDSSGNLGQIPITIAGDRIVRARYVELIPKTRGNYPYRIAVDAVATIQSRLIESRNIAAVDAVTGATATSSRLTEAVDDALRNAGSVGSYTDGTYVGYSTADNLGNIGYAIITVSGGNVADAELADLQVKSRDNYQYQASLDAWATLEQSLVTSQDVTRVDAVTGATGTSTLFREAATAALETARTK